MAMPMEGGGGTLPVPTTQVKVEKLNVALQQQLNLESVKTRALGLYKTISRILEDFDAIARLNASPKWQDILGQFSMVNLELFNIVEDIKKVSKAFVVHPNNVNAENATILPVMLSTKLLPEMEAEDNCKREQLLHGMQNLPVPMQIEKLKNRIDMIGAACESAEKVIADTRKAYGLGSRQGPTTVPTIDKVQAAKIQEQENLLRAAVNSGEGLRIPRDQRNLLPPVLPLHLVDVLNVGDSTHNLADSSGVYSKNTQTSLPSNIVNPQGVMLQATGTQLMGRSVPSPSPSGVTGVTSFENASPSPLSYTNSPRSSTNLMNAPSPQQQAQQQQRQKLVQLPQHQQQLLAQQLRQSSGALGQFSCLETYSLNLKSTFSVSIWICPRPTRCPRKEISSLPKNAVQQMHDLQGQNQQKFQQLQEQHQMQYPQSLNQQAFQNRQLQPNILQHNIGQNQINQGNPLRSHLGQFAGAANNPLFNAAQTSPNTQMMSNMPTSITPQTLLPRMQFGVPGMSAQRNHPQILGDQMYGMGASNATAILSMQQQQQLQQQQGGFGNLPTSNQNIQSGMASLQSTQQNPNYPQQRQQNQQ